LSIILEKYCATKPIIPEENQAIASEVNPSKAIARKHPMNETTEFNAKIYVKIKFKKFFMLNNKS
jgi:hypothetical protein